MNPGLDFLKHQAENRFFFTFSLYVGAWRTLTTGHHQEEEKKKLTPSGLGRYSPPPASSEICFPSVPGRQQTESGLKRRNVHSQEKLRALLSLFPSEIKIIRIISLLEKNTAFFKDAGCCGCCEYLLNSRRGDDVNDLS